MGAGEMARGLRAPAALPEDPGSVPSTEMVVNKCLSLRLQVTPSSCLWHMSQRESHEFASLAGDLSLGPSTHVVAISHR